MHGDPLEALPARRGHFLLESGYHTDVWLTLDALFRQPRALTPMVTALAARLAPHRVAGVCGPLLGGAFLAQALASTMGVEFYFCERIPATEGPGLFTAAYRLPEGLRRPVRGLRVAVVDDAISAGSSVRATAAALQAAGASIAVVGTLLATGTIALGHFAQLGVPVEALDRRELTLWAPADCPLCRDGTPLEDPTRIEGPG
jgi:orotate phosphoribosyltransferase